MKDDLVIVVRPPWQPVLWLRHKLRLCNARCPYCYYEYCVFLDSIEVGKRKREPADHFAENCEPDEPTDKGGERCTCPVVNGNIKHFKSCAWSQVPPAPPAPDGVEGLIGQIRTMLENAEKSYGYSEVHGMRVASGIIKAQASELVRTFLAAEVAAEREQRQSNFEAWQCAAKSLAQMNTASPCGVSGHMRSTWIAPSHATVTGCLRCDDIATRNAEIARLTADRADCLEQIAKQRRELDAIGRHANRLNEPSPCAVPGHTMAMYVEQPIMVEAGDATWEDVECYCARCDEVREAKAQAYERCAAFRANTTGQNDAFTESFREWANAERKRATRS